MDNKQKTDAEILRVTTKQTIVALLTALSSLVLVIGGLGYLIVNYFVHEIGNNTDFGYVLADQQAIHDLEIAAIKDRIEDCEALHFDIVLEANEYRKRDEKRMDKIESSLSRMDAEQESNRRSLVECWKRMP